MHTAGDHVENGCDHDSDPLRFGEAAHGLTVAAPRNRAIRSILSSEILVIVGQLHKTCYDNYR